MQLDVQEFIANHKTKSIAELALLLSKNQELPKEYIINQINGKQKAPNKFPFLGQFSDYIFPSPRAFSQASSEETARYKAAILKADRVLDLSGGMGMDSYFFAQHAKQSDYVELNDKLVETAKSNFETLGAANVTSHCAKAEDFIELSTQEYDLVYLDPDRRSAKEKAFKIDDCEPNVATLLPQIWKKSKYCMVKLSPMLDIQQALTQLPNCKEVHVVSVNNDCKELLFLLEKDSKSEPNITCVNLKKENDKYFEFTFQEERTTSIEFSDIETYLYEPNASIMKAGPFKSIASQLELKKLATNTHLYTSETLLKNFPGRTLNVLDHGKPQKGFTKQANVVSRNFPLTPEQIKKKYKIKDGGNQFLYACSLEDGSKSFVVGELVLPI